MCSTQLVRLAWDLRQSFTISGELQMRERTRTGFHEGHIAEDVHKACVFLERTGFIFYSFYIGLISSLKVMVNIPLYVLVPLLCHLEKYPQTPATTKPSCDEKGTQ